MKVVANKPAEEVEETRVKRHAVFNATPQQIDNYIENNVTDLASAKEALKLIAKVAIIGRRLE